MLCTFFCTPVLSLLFAMSVCGQLLRHLDKPPPPSRNKTFQQRILPVFPARCSCEINLCEKPSGYLPFSQPPTTLVTIMNRVPTPLTPTAQHRARGFFEQMEHRNLGGRKYFYNVRVRSSSLYCVTPNLLPRLRRKRRNGRCQKSFCRC